MLEQVKEAVASGWSLLFGAKSNDKDDAGVVIRFMGFLQANPIFLLPLGLYLIVLGIKTTRKLITGF